MVGAVLSKTANYGFNRIRFDMPGWHGLEHDNWTLADALLASIGSIPGSRGIWTNGTPYVEGDRVADPDGGGLYRCAVAHTSAVSGSFADDRAAHTTYWTLITQVPVWVGTWLTGINYNPQDIVRQANAYYYCIASHTAGVFANDLAAGRWTLVFDLQDAYDQANAAAASALAAAGSASAASISASNANNSAISAANSASDANNSKNAAATSASNAGTSASNAASSATNASNSATAANNSKNAAAISESNAATSATNANNSAIAAAASAATIANDKVQPGALEFYLTSSAPAGRLKANGALIDVSVYAALVAAIYCGNGNNATAGWGYRTNSTDTVRSTTGTHLRLPDWRGEFTRGFDDGRGVDSGRSLWAAQTDLVKAHTHSITDPGHFHVIDSYISGAVGASGRPQEGSSGSTDSFGTLSETTGISVQANVGTENRPRNQVALACIKY